jgi:hypothetical protein
MAAEPGNVPFYHKQLMSQKGVESVKLTTITVEG